MSRTSEIQSSAIFALRREAPIGDRPVAGRPRRTRRYGWIGAALGLGAPLAFAALRGALAWSRNSRRWRPADRWLAYGYMTATTPLVFGLFGRIIGQSEDRLSETFAQIERLREEFAAVVAHDLRNPIQAILLQIQALRRQAQDAEVTVSVATLERLERGAKRLSEMVDDLLDATRIEAARLRLGLRTVSVPEIVSGLIERIRPTLGAHPVEVDVASVPLVLADPLRLEQILTNLLDNAAKYSPVAAPIAVRVAPAGGGVTISVEDRGHGIDPEDLPRLFDRFYQAKRAREKKSGLGLGLYITKGLVAAHGGGIDVRARAGGGSVFSVWLPGAGDRGGGARAGDGSSAQ